MHRPVARYWVKMLSKTELRSPDGHRNSSDGGFTEAALRWLRVGLVVVVMGILAVEWLHIHDLRLRVAELEHTCQSTSSDKDPLTMFNDHLPNDHPPSNDQRFAAEVCYVAKVSLTLLRSVGNNNSLPNDEGPGPAPQYFFLEPPLRDATMI